MFDKMVQDNDRGTAWWERNESVSHAGEGYEVIGGVYGVRLGFEDRQRQKGRGLLPLLHVMVT